MNKPLFNPNFALAKINARLGLAGEKDCSRTTFYRARGVFASIFPESRWIAGGRLIYSDQAMVFLYFLLRLQVRTQNWKATESMARLYVSSLPGNFSDSHPTYSSVDSLFASDRGIAA